MKLKEKQTIVAMTDAELRKQIAAINKHLAEVRVTRFTKQIKNVRETRRLRTKRAVMMTALRQKELAYGNKAK